MPFTSLRCDVSEIGITTFLIAAAIAITVPSSRGSLELGSIARATEPGTAAA